jgi:transposase
VESRNPYDTDLTDAEWHHLQPLVPAVKPGGRPAKHARREILNAIFYIVRSGSAWKLLPHDLPPWRTVYHYYWLWRRDGTWQKIHDSVRALVRQTAGREVEPSDAIVDSQTVRTSEGSGANVKPAKKLDRASLSIDAGYAARAACQISGILAGRPPSLPILN